MLLALLAPVAASADPELNGFRLSNNRVAEGSIRAGGPDRDRVPRVDDPDFVAPGEASWVDPETPVIGVAVGKAARVYPVHLMEYHQVVNDELGGTQVLVTYDPLTATPRAYARSVDGEVLRFGVSGLIHNSNFLLYDLSTESLWSQFTGECIAGKLAGRKLTRLSVRQESLRAWLGRHPESRVLVRPEPQRFDYRYSPYKAYWLQEGAPFRVEHGDERFHAKEVVLGVEVEGRTRAYIGSLVTAQKLHVEDELQGRRIVIDYDPEASLFTWEAPDDVRVTDAYWFAWKAFHPDTEVWGESQ